MQSMDLLLSLWVSDISLSIGDGKILAIAAHGLSEGSSFVKSVMVNGPTVESELNLAPRQFIRR